MGLVMNAVNYEKRVNFSTETGMSCVNLRPTAPFALHRSKAAVTLIGKLSSA